MNEKGSVVSPMIGIGVVGVGEVGVGEVGVGEVGVGEVDVVEVGSVLGSSAFQFFHNRCTKPVKPPPF